MGAAWLMSADKRTLLEHYLKYGYEETLRALPRILNSEDIDLHHQAELYVEGMYQIEHKRRMEK